MRLLFTDIGEYRLFFYYREVEQVLEIKKSMIEKQKIGNVLVPHILYQGYVLPFFAAAVFLETRAEPLIRYGIVIKDIKGEPFLALGVPELVEEIELEDRQLLLFPNFLISKEFLEVFFAVVYYERKYGLLMSFSELQDIHYLLEGILTIQKGRFLYATQR